MNPHRASFSRQPLAQLAVAFCAGICFVNYLSPRLFVLLLADGVCSAVSITAVVKNKLTVAGVALLLATSLAGATLAVQERRDDRSELWRQFFGEHVILTGVLQAPPELGKDRSEEHTSELQSHSF